MILYHFTSKFYCREIYRDGLLRTTESNVSAMLTHAGPDVVWLTSGPRPYTQGWRKGSIMNKSEMRFSVRLPDPEIHHWREWALRQGSEEKRLDALATCGGSDRWFVITRPVPRSEWLDIEDTNTGASWSL